MSKTQHTPEPWINQDDLITAGAGHNNFGIIADLLDSEFEPSEILSNARRIVACVNACAGINPEAVPDLIKALEDVCPVLFHAANNQRRTPLDTEQAKAAFLQARAVLAKAKAKAQP